MAPDVDQANMHATVTECAVKTFYHVFLGCFDQTQRQKRWNGVPGQMTVCDEESGFERGVALGERLKLGDVMLRNNI